jgi:hypothetical protein
MTNPQLTRQVTAASSVVGRAAAVELASCDRAQRSQHRLHARAQPRLRAAGGRHDAVVFPNLGPFVITCLDPHVDPAHS